MQTQNTQQSLLLRLNKIKELQVCVYLFILLYEGCPNAKRVIYLQTLMKGLVQNYTRTHTVHPFHYMVNRKLPKNMKTNAILHACVELIHLF